MAFPLPEEHQPVAACHLSGEDTLTVVLAGELDYETSDAFLTHVTEALAQQTHLAHLRLDCGRLGTVDSMGLAILLQIKRRLQPRGITLYLDDRSEALERLLTITGTLDHLTAPHTGATPRPPGA